MGFVIVCTRCGEKLRGENEYEAEIKWTIHECEGKRRLEEMDTDLVRYVAVGAMSEEEAWIEQDARRN